MRWNPNRVKYDFQLHHVKRCTFFSLEWRIMMVVKMFQIFVYYLFIVYFNLFMLNLILMSSFTPKKVSLTSGSGLCGYSRWVRLFFRVYMIQKAECYQTLIVMKLQFSILYTNKMTEKKLDNWMRGKGNSILWLQGQQKLYIMHFSSEVCAMNCNYIVFLKWRAH